MLLPPFDKPGRFWRGNLHCHSTRSDGALAPDEVARRYRANGYDFYCQTDHFLESYGFPITDTSDLRSEGFTTLLGAELHAPALGNGEVWHILAVGLPADFPQPSADETGPDLARRARDAGAFVAIAHPQWYGVTLEDARTLDAAHAVEVYNHTCAVLADRPDGSALLDEVLLDGLSLLAIATDDAHFRDPLNSNADAFGGWVMVRAESLSPEILLSALKAGEFYASQGPELHAIEIGGDTLTLSASALERVVVVGPRSLAVTVAGRSMTTARLDVSRFKGGWARLIAIDAAGRRAWSNPFDVPE